MNATRIFATVLFATTAGCTVTTGAVADVPIVNCESGTSDMHCQSVPTATIGSGPSFASLGGAASLNSGFLEGHRLVVGASTGYDAHGVALGALVEIDITTRARRVILGSYLDAARGVVSAPSSAQPGFSLGPVHDVQPSTARSDMPGRWFAVGTDGLLSIEPDVHTELVVRRDTDLACDEFGTVSRLSFDTLAVDDTDHVLLVANESEVVAVDPRDRSCRLVSSNIRTPGPAAHAIRALRFARGALWALDDASVFLIDVTTGERTRVSSPAADGRIGGGASVLGGSSLDVTSDRAVWTAGNGGLFVAVDDRSGLRTRLEPSGGPSVIFDVGGVWTVPDTPVLVATAGSGVLVANTVTGTINWLSR